MDGIKGEAIIERKRIIITSITRITRKTIIIRITRIISDKLIIINIEIRK